MTFALTSFAKGVEHETNIDDKEIESSEDETSVNLGELVVVDNLDNAKNEVLDGYNHIFQDDAKQIITLGHNDATNRFDATDSGRQACQVQLLQLLDSSNAPLHLFDDIMKWAQRASLQNAYDFSKNPPLRKHLVSKLITNNGYSQLLPKVIQFKLPCAGQETKVITHNVLESIHSLLSDPNLMTEKNLIFKQNPLEDPNEYEKEFINDINDGDCYKSAYNLYCGNKSTDVLCPLILFIDKTHIDVKGNLTLEPVCLTLGIFNQDTRNKEDSWRIVGFIPSTNQISNQKLQSYEKQIDYHAMLEVILAPLIQIQKTNGIAWDLSYGSKIYNVVLKIPILFVTGDSEGQDKLVGRRLVYSNLRQSAHICRYCNVSFEDTDNPKFKGSLTRSSQIQKLISEKNYDKLDSIGYLKLVKNAMHDLEYCDPEHGINGSLPADILHTYQLGICIYTLDGLFSQKKTSVGAQKRIRREMESEDPSEFFNGATIENSDKSTHNIFNLAETDWFNETAKIFGRLIGRQSDRDLPRLYFSSGIISDKKKNGNEMQGVALVVLFIFLSEFNEKFRVLFGGDQIGTRRLQTWILLLERLIMIEEFLKGKSFERKIVEKFKRWLPIFMEFLKNVVDRQESSKFKLLKFHLLTHMGNDILKFGPPSSFNSATGESNHKMLKRRSRKTQKQANLMTEQTGFRYVEQLSIMRSMPSTIFKNNNGDESSIKFTGYLCYMNSDGIFTCTKERFFKTESIWADNELQQSVFDLLKTQILPNIEGKTIRFMTNLVHGDLLYRGDPKFKEGSWHDWAYCDWGNRHGICPIQIQIFVDLHNLQNNITINDVHISTSSRYYAVVHMVENPLDSEINGKNFKAHPQSKIFFKAKKWVDPNSKPVLALVDVDSIVSPCIGVPNSLTKGENVFIFMKSRSNWSDLLAKSITANLKNKQIS